MSSQITVPRICEFCHQQFIAKTTTTRFCSLRCNSRNYKATLRALKIENSNQQTVHAVQQQKLPLMEKALLTVMDVAELLGFSNKSVYQLINSGQLKVVKVTARKTRIRCEDFKEFVAFRGVAPSAEKAKVTADRPEQLTRQNCYSIPELIDLFKKNRGDLYVFLKRARVSRIKIKKEVFFSKSEADKLFRKFVKPKPLGYDNQRAANNKLAVKGFQLSDCYSMEQCERLLNQKRENLYSKFSRRKVPKIRQGQEVYYLRKAVDKIYGSLTERREL
ncbi:MAG: helix-turn-helix domain-containing protein [Bacteroidota bacterium]